MVPYLTGLNLALAHAHRPDRLSQTSGSQNVGDWVSCLILGGAKAIDLDNVCCDFGNFRAVDHVNVNIQPGEFFSFLGPSGCGKTTILRMISGFIDPSSGTIRIGGMDMQGQRPNQRPTALIFQNLALFPLMPVWENISFDWSARRRQDHTPGQSRRAA
jgi:ABC-type Fe3+/spermidine/putrescine transport system ATPase subunit